MIGISELGKDASVIGREIQETFAESTDTGHTFSNRSWTERGRVECPKCHKIFSNVRNCRRHFEIIHQKLRYTCECGKSYKRPESLRDHIASVHFDQSYECPCGKRYVHKKNIRDHSLHCPFYTSSTESQVNIGQNSC